MAEIPLLGQKRPEPASEAPSIVEADYAFIVAYVEGQLLVIPDLNAPVVSGRYPTPDDITGAAANMLKHRQSEQTVGLTINTMQQQAQQAMARQQTAGIQQMLAKEKR